MVLNHPTSWTLFNAEWISDSLSINSSFALWPICHDFNMSVQFLDIAPKYRKNTAPRTAVNAYPTSAWQSTSTLLQNTTPEVITEWHFPCPFSPWCLRLPTGLLVSFTVESICLWHGEHWIRSSTKISYLIYWATKQLSNVLKGYLMYL